MIEHVEARSFGKASKAALNDEILHGALAKATGLFAERRKAAIGSVPDWEALRERARIIKEETLGRLDVYLEQFVENAEAAGAIIHWARDGAEARDVIAQIVAQTPGIVVKSKSMTTEEIALNEGLEALGRHPVETDLGEWIIQRAGETPSHIIVPAIHKTKGQIADLFAQELTMERTEDEALLTQAAREELRRQFAESTVGISGVNFGVAETGTILILENEGNARLTTSLPRVHIALMGIEKVIPRLTDLELFLKLLPRSGTGQHLTSYQSLLTGPTGVNGEGPEEVHIVLMDNGRSPMLAKEVTRQSLACIRCGACLNACPVYQQVGGHAYGSVYPGPIGAVITPQLASLEQAGSLPFASTLCGACREVCPVKIDIPALLLHLRSEVVEGTLHQGPTKRPFMEALGFRGWAWFMSGRRRYAFAAAMARWAHRQAHRGGWFGRLIVFLTPPLKQWTAARDLRAPAAKTFLNGWRENGR